MWEILSVLLLVTVAVGMLAPRLLRQRPSGDSLSGTLLITGVSARPDALGEQYVTITGVIDGPTISDYTVYLRMVADVEHVDGDVELVVGIGGFEQRGRGEESRGT